MMFRLVRFHDHCAHPWPYQMADAADLGVATHRLPGYLRVAFETAAQGGRTRQESRRAMSIRPGPRHCGIPLRRQPRARHPRRRLARRLTPSRRPARRCRRSRSEVTGSTEDGTSETITLHEVSAEGETETIVRIADDAGNVETVVTGSPVEEIDLVHLGSPGGGATSRRSKRSSKPKSRPKPRSMRFSTHSKRPNPPWKRSRSSRQPRLSPRRRPSARQEPSALRRPRNQWSPPKRDRPRLAHRSRLGARRWLASTARMSHPVKAKANSMIYYVPESGHYGLTIPDVCFAADIDAKLPAIDAPRR